MRSCSPHPPAFRPHCLPLLLLLLALISTNSAVFFAARTLLPITSGAGVMYGPPYGYKGPTADLVTTVDPAGSLNVSYAFDAYAAWTLRRGILPFWNPYQGLGQPFLANSLSAVLYPLNWLHVVLPPAWWDMVYLLNWLLAALFLYAYLRLIDIERGAALVGAGTILGSGFFQIYLALREVPAVAAWWPLLLYGVERSIREPAWRRRHLLLAGAIYCTIVGGQPEVAFLSLFVVLVYALLRVAMQKQNVWRAFWALVPGTLAGLFLAAPMWLNFAEYALAAYSVHQADTTAGQLHLDFSSVATYVFPYLYGRLHTTTFAAITDRSWDLCPGWLPATGVFLAGVSLSAIFTRRDWRACFLWGVAGIIGAKIWGVPGVSLLGHLPLLERLIFPRYAGFLLAFAFAGLAAYGACLVSQWEASSWQRWLRLWGIVIATLFALGLHPIWSTVRHSDFLSPPTLTVLAFGGGGLLWAVVGPLGLWWLRSLRPQETDLLYFLAALAILLQSVAYAPLGSSSRTHAMLSVSCLGLYVLTVLVLGLVQRIRMGSRLLATGFALLALPSLFAALFAAHALAIRYNPLTPAPYLDTLTTAPNPNLYRSYSLDGVLHPNFAVPFAITSLNAIEPLLPSGSAEFIKHDLDRGVNPLWFAGSVAAGRSAQFPALGEFWTNKRYFDLVGVKYLLTQRTDPRPVLYDTETFGAEREAIKLVHPLEASISCPADTLSSIHVLLSTYAGSNPGTATLQIFSDAGILLGQQALDTTNLPDNVFEEFRFAPLQGLAGQRLRLRLEFFPAQPDSRIAAWIYPDQPELGFALRIADQRPLSTFLTLLYEDPETDVRLWENPAAVPRVFLAPSGRVALSGQESLEQLQYAPDLTRQVWIEQGPEISTPWPETQSPGELLAFELAANTVRVRYQAKTAGILTLTDSYAEGWHVALNGQEVPVLRVDGVFRGMRIAEPGTYEVYFWYRPPYWNLSLGMAVIGGLLLTAMSCFEERLVRVARSCLDWPERIAHAVPLRWQATVCLLLMLVSVNSAVFFGGRTLLPLTSTPGVLLPPYGYTGPGADGLTSLDPWGSLNVAYAFDAYAALAFQHGNLPFWNPYQGLGQPFLANGLSAVFYPLNWLHLILPPAWWDMVFVANWLLAAVFLYAYLRLLGVCREAALVAGAAICGSGFFQGYLTLREVVAVAAWWPLLLYGVERSLREPGWRWRHPVLALAVYCTITGGQPEVTFLSLVTVLVYGLIRLVMQKRHLWRAIGAVLPGTLAGLFLAAPMWINFVQYAFTAYSTHRVDSGVGQFQLGVKTLAAYVFPSFYGRIHTTPFGPIAGWVWNWAPGWLPATGMFLALVSLATVLQKRRWAMRFLWGVAGVTGAKIWGVPGIALLGRLPLLERIIFPRYAGFLLASAFAGLAAYGMSALTKFDSTDWKRWAKVWAALIVILFILGLQPIWGAVQKSGWHDLPRLTLVIFAGLGLAWAVVGPLGLWWLASRRRHETSLLYFLAAVGILLQGVACAAHGYSLSTYAVLSVSGLGLYIVVALTLGLAQRIESSGSLILVGFAVVALPSLLAAFFTSYGLATRYNPLTPAPYLNVLTTEHSPNLYRVYSLDGALQANFAVPFAISSLNILEPLLPASVAEFMQRYLDRGTPPLWFLGNFSPGRNEPFTALAEFWNNKRYFDFVGVRYVITQGSDPGVLLYDTEKLGVGRNPIPLLQPLEIPVTCPTENLSSVQVLLSTYGRNNPGMVTLKILSGDGVLLRQQQADATRLLNNSFREFTFPPLGAYKDQLLRVRLEFTPARPDSMIAAWIYPDRPELGFALRIADQQSLSASLSLLYQDADTDVRIWENRAAVPRVFLAPGGRVAPSWQEAMTQLQHTPNLTRQVWIEQGPEMAATWPETQAPGELLTFSLAPNAVRVQYQAQTSGILTLTDSYAEGWHVALNGREAPLLRVNGAFRGVRIEQPGTYEVLFWYRPPYWTLSLVVAGVGLLLLIGTNFLDWRRRAA